MHSIDLRSDTITKPTPNMRRAMAEADVGDDVFGEDPTVNRLERMAAESMGKDSALFVASGTMGNVVSLLTHCGRGDEVILGDRSHIFLNEQGGMAALGGIHPRVIRNEPEGTMDIGDVEAAIRSDNVHYPRTRLIALENTHNSCDGTPLRRDWLGGIRRIADRYGLRVHMDGARIFNAAVAQGVKAAELASEADSVTFCLSKGLAAPVGSVVCGTREFIAVARRTRKVIGGGMRQAGVLAAAGIVALEEMIDRLADDHANARKLARGLSEIAGLLVDPERIKTNIVHFGIEPKGAPAASLAEKLASEGVLVLPTGPSRLRAVTHYHITSDDIDRALEAFRRVMRQ